MFCWDLNFLLQPRWALLKAAYTFMFLFVKLWEMTDSQEAGVSDAVTRCVSSSTHFQLTDSAGQSMARASCGTEGFKNRRKSTPIAAQTAGIAAAAVSAARRRVTSLSPHKIVPVQLKLETTASAPSPLCVATLNSWILINCCKQTASSKDFNDGCEPAVS